MEKEAQLEAYKAYLTDMERAPNTICSYLWTVKNYFSVFDEVSKANMIAFKQSQIEQWKPQTAALRCTAMNQYCDFIGKPQCKVKTVKVPKRTSVENVITIEEFQQFCAELLRDNQMENYWLIQYLAKTGARVSEIIRFEKKHLDAGEVTMWTKGKMRRILVPASLISESRSYFDGVDSRYLFPNRYGKQSTTREIDARIQRNGQKYGIRKEVLHPHSFRHLYAIQFLKHNNNISLLADLMGHESVNTTSIYLRMSAEEQRRQFEQAMKW